MRNIAARGRAGDVTAEQAIEDLVLDDAVLYAIRDSPHQRVRDRSS